MEQIFFTQKDQIGREKSPIEKMAQGGLITPKKPIEKMTMLELQNFVLEFDPIKYQEMNWFKGQTRKGLRVQVQKIYDRYVERRLAEEASRSELDRMDGMDDMDYFAGGGKAGDRKSPSESATSVQEGTIGIGNDGTLYATKLNKNGVGAWRQVNQRDFKSDLRILEYQQAIIGNDKKYDGYSTIQFYWENDFGIELWLNFRQKTRIELQIELQFLSLGERVITLTEISQLANTMVSSAVMNQFVGKIREDQYYADKPLSDIETMAVVASENLKHDLLLIEQSFRNVLDTVLPSLYNYSSTELNMSFNRRDLLSQPATFDPFEVNKPSETTVQEPKETPEKVELSPKSPKKVKKEVNAIIENAEAPKKTRKELQQDYADLSFLISITPSVEVVTMTELKQQARVLKDEIDRLGLIEKDIMLAENHIFDELFQASSVKPKHRYDLTPAIDGFAPDGTPTQLPQKIYDMTQTDEFEDWFGNYQLAYQFKNTPYSEVPCSIVKNIHYEPQIVYHGTGSEFSFFDFNQFPAMYFAENIAYAEWFANQKGGLEGHDGYVYPFFLNIKNPLDLTHFGINEISPKEFTDWMYLQCGLLPDELKINPALLNSTQKYWAWVYLRNGAEMLKVLRDTKLFDGIVYFEQNPPIAPTAPNYMTKGFIIFEANNAKIVDPERHNVLLASMRSFYLKKGGKL